jgi:hypothetical protein
VSTNQRSRDADAWAQREQQAKAAASSCLRPAGAASPSWFRSVGSHRTKKEAPSWVEDLQGKAEAPSQVRLAAARSWPAPAAGASAPPWSPLASPGASWGCLEVSAAPSERLDGLGAAQEERTSPPPTRPGGPGRRRTRTNWGRARRCGGSGRR